jgi:hypothetical protein
LVGSLSNVLSPARAFQEYRLDPGFDIAQDIFVGKKYLCFLEMVDRYDKKYDIYTLYFLLIFNGGTAVG